jgi:hypothetical protein
MKKVGIIIFGLLSIFLLSLAGSVAAYNAEFTATCFAGVAPTIDGQYAAGEEWGSAGTTSFGTNGQFKTQWCMSPSVYASFLIETTDTTNDAGDYWVICFDATEDGGMTEPDGGSAPQANDFKLVITGHDSPTVQWYKGTGTAWTPITPVGFDNTAIFNQAQSLSASPMSSTPHYIWEMSIDKTNTEGLGITPMGYNWAQYIAYYDAHAGGAGLQAWPPTPASDTNPDSWGYVPYSSDPVPESLSIVLVIALSSVAVIAGSVLLRKRSIAKLASKHKVAI